jgi:hypothetical protein
LVAFFLFVFGAILEVIQDGYFIDALYDDSFSSSSIGTERAFLIVMTILYIIAIFIVTVLLFCFTCCKFFAMIFGKEGVNRYL